MIVGFTGTQYGMTEFQKEQVKLALHYLKSTTLVIPYFKHGDCVGADEQADRIARDEGYQIVIHPGNNSGKRARCENRGKSFVLPVKPNLIRNRDIVDDADIMIACPQQDREILRSGTWATIRYARKMKRILYIIGPAGFIN